VATLLEETVRIGLLKIAATKRRELSELQGPDTISPLDAGINKNIHQQRRYFFLAISVPS
jgi:hypothetical protein